MNLNQSRLDQLDTMWIIGGVISWRIWLETGKHWKAEKANATDRSRFMAILGMLAGALFTLPLALSQPPPFDTFRSTPCATVPH